MNIEFLKNAGQIAGLGGLALGVFLPLHRQLLSRNNLFSRLTRGQTFRILRLFLILVWSIAALAARGKSGLGPGKASRRTSSTGKSPPPPFFKGGRRRPR